MSFKNILPVTTVKKQLMKLLQEAQDYDRTFIITKDGKAAGVLMGTEEYEGLLETLDILSNSETVRGLKRAEEDFRKGRVFSHE